MITKCIHDMIPETCSFCKNKPEYKNLLKTNLVNLRARGGLQNDQNNQINPGKCEIDPREYEHKNHLKEGVMKEKEKCLITDCTEKAFCRGLCHPHYDAWKNGKTDHPTLGKFTVIKPQTSAKNPKKPETIHKQPKTSVKKEPETLINNLNLDETGMLAKEFRKRLHEAETLGQALVLLGKKSAVNIEIGCFMQRFE